MNTAILHYPSGSRLRSWYSPPPLVGIDYLFFAGYTMLQFIVLATAWNILGGYCGYVNFGSAAFFALGAYHVGFHAQNLSAADAGPDAGRRRGVRASSASAWAI